MTTGNLFSSTPLRRCVVGSTACGVFVMLVMIAGFELTDGGGPGASAFGSRTLIAIILVLWLVLVARDKLLHGASGSLVFVLVFLATASATLAYALTWEVYLWFTDYAFIERYLEQHTGAVHAEKLRLTLFNPFRRMLQTMLEFAPTATAVISVGFFALTRWNLPESGNKQ